jgi:hypothetical protein
MYPTLNVGHNQPSRICHFRQECLPHALGPSRTLALEKLQEQSADRKTA